MKHIYFMTSDGGTWDCLDVPRQLPFLKILQRFIALENAVGMPMRIFLEENGKSEDVTQWVFQKLRERK